MSISDRGKIEDLGTVRISQKQKPRGNEIGIERVRPQSRERRRRKPLSDLGARLSCQSMIDYSQK